MYDKVLLVIVGLIAVWVIQAIYRHNQDYILWKHDEQDVPVDQTIIFTSVNESYIGELVKKHMSYMEKYAERHHEISIKRFVHGDGKISPYWTRVHDLLDLCNSYPDDTLFVYLDTDAIVNSKYFDVSISEFIADVDPGKTRDIYISEDPLADYPFFYDGTYNTGVFIVRNSTKSREFVRSWLSLYNPEEWSYSGNKWKCKVNDRECVWSGLGYEQYAFSKLSEKKPGIVMRLHHSVLANMDYRDTRAFVIHLMGKPDNYRINVINKLNKML